MMFSRKPINRPIVCHDGFEMSVQASENHYSIPRQDDGPYTHVEVGFPSEKVDLLMPYAENADADDPTEEVYAWVPAEVVMAIVIAHDGIAFGELPDLKMVLQRVERIATAPRSDDSEQDGEVVDRFTMLEFD